MSEESYLSDVTSQESSFTSYDTEGTIQSTATIPSETLNIKKVAWNADEEYVRKFTQGEPIIDQRNPFKTTHRSYDKKSPTKTRIPQLKREQFKNAINSLKKSTSDELITTEEVLKQSKYVKTYIKNPDPYFVYDPAILERIRADEQQKKGEATNLLMKKDSSRALKKKILPEKQTKDVKTPPKSKIPYKKCAKPNYPNLSDIKVKVGTELDGSYLNPAEIKTNARKFDECVKLKKHLNFDEDSEDMEEQLETSSADKEIVMENPTDTHCFQESNINETNEIKVAAESINGSFTNTINSKDFQQYLEKKGLELTPQKAVHESKTTRIYTTPPKPKRTSIIQKAPEFKESIYQRPSSLLVIEPKSSPKKVKKSSIFQRLLMHNLFSAKRKTTPKETVPMARSSYDSGRKLQIKENIKPPLQNRRILLQSNSKPAESPSLEFRYISGPALDCDSAKSHDQMDNATSSRTSKNGVSEALLPVPSVAPQNFAASSTSTTNNFNQKNIPLKPITQSEQAPYSNQQLFARTRSMDRSEILRRSRAVVPLRTIYNDPAKANRFNTRSITSDILFEPSGPQTTSTPIRKKIATEPQRKLCNSSSTLASSVGGDDGVHTNSNISKNDWLRLREQQQLQQHTDRELYSQVLNRKPRNNENLYERLPVQSLQVAPAEFQPIYSSVDQRSYFVRGGPQRNTFSGVSRDMNYKNYNNNIDVADEQTHSENNFQLNRSGNESLLQRNQPSRLSQTNTLSREEIIEKVKQFCRNSIRRNNDKQLVQRKANDVRLSGTEISPASYASVETQQFFPTSRKAAPQVPQRIQSLQRQQDMAKRAPACSTTPIYANIWKGGSGMPMQSAALPRGMQYPRAQSIPNRLKERMALENPVNERQHIEPNVRMVQAASRYASDNLLSNCGNLIKPIEKPPRCSPVINSPSQLTVQPVQNNGRCTPLILTRSQNLQSQIYQPQYRDSRLRLYNNERSLAPTNQRFGQYISGSLDLHSENYKEQFTDPRNLGQQLLLPEQYIELYVPETAEIQRSNGRKFSSEF